MTTNDKCPECGAKEPRSGFEGTLFECASVILPNGKLFQTERCKLNVANQQIATLQAELTAAVTAKEQAERERESIVASLQPLQYNGTLAEKVHNVVEELRAWSSREFETQLRAESAEAERDELRCKLEAIEVECLKRKNGYYLEPITGKQLANKLLAILNPPPSGETK